MQKKWSSILARLSMLIAIIFFNSAKAQQSLTQINGWNAYVHLPAGYATSGLKYPTIIFAPGIGEVGTNAGAVISNGPGAYIAQGWNGNVTVDGATVEFIVISIQPPSAFPTEATYNQRIQTIKNLYRVDPQRLYLTGLSHGGWMSSTFVTGDAYGGPYNYASQIAAVVTVQGMIPDDNAPYPNLFDNFANAGGRYLGFEQTNDGRDTRRVVDRMNATKPNSAVYVQTSFGNGGHCCWNQFYGGQGVNPGVFNLGGINQNLYQWLARQTLASATNIAPLANAGPDINIALPTNTALLNGSATDADGTVLTYLWNQIAGPGAATIVNNALGVTVVNNLMQGQYKFELTVMDNMGSYGKDTMQLTVNPDPSTLTCNTNAPVTHYLTKTNTGTGVWEIYRPNGSAWKGGDTVKIVGNYYSVIEFSNIAGDPCRPIVIMPQTTLTTPVFRIKGNSRYVKIWGGPTAYGIKVTPGSIAVNLSHHIEVNNVECSFGSVGVYAKQDVVYSDPLTWHPNYRMSNLIFRNMWVHDVQGEGMYIGITQPDGLTVTSTYSGFDTTILPIRLDSVEVSNCIVERTDWDGIQLSNARNGNKIINNTVRDYGRINMSAQQAGIILGGNCTGDISGNTVLRGTGSGIQVFGYGVININNNLLDSCGYNGQTNPNGSYGLQSIYANDYIINSESNPKQTINAFGNAVNHPLTGGGIFITDYLNNSFPSSVYNNTFCIPGADANWQSIYIKAYVPGSTVTNNSLSCSTVPNAAPAANAGADVNITLPTSTATLTGFGSDVDGTIVSHAWTKLSGPSGGNISSPATASTGLTALIEGLYKYQLTVTDNLGAIGRDTVQVIVSPRVNTAPTANAGSDISITLPANTVNLTGTATDSDGTIASYAWTKIAGPAAGVISNNTAANAVASSLTAGIYLFQLTVLDNDGASGKDTVKVTVLPAPNLLPTVNAGVDISLTLPLNTTLLTGVANDPDGSIATFQWTKLSGPAAGTLTNAGTAIATASGLQQGVYQFRLTVTDNSGATASDSINVSVNPAPNLAPLASAGDDQTISLPINTATLNGSGSDADGSIVSYAWVKVAGPSGDVLTNSTAAVAAVTGLNAGVYLYSLTVTDNAGASASDTLQITVLAAGTNAAPIANAGADQVITLPNNSATLAGTATDTDGTIVSFNWARISGPSTGNLSNAGNATASLTGLVQGIYNYELSVTDDDGAIGKDTIQVTVNPANNVAPSANAGADVSITLPTNNTILNGAGIDPDGSISSFLWEKIAGPVGGTITNGATAQTPVSGLVQGIYLFQLTVADNAGAIGRDTVQVTVNAAPNLAPVVNAGANINLTLPVNSTTLTGSAIDSDGSISSYAWSKIAGPAAGVIASPAAATTPISGLVQGVYQFKLTVADNAGATASDTVQVTVQPAPNQAPSANAGNNISITLPVNTAQLNGSGTDPDGTISTYSWSKIAGPAAGSITNSNAAVATANGLVTGVYQFQLIVTDNNGASGRDTMQLTVNPAPNVAPQAHAGNDITITLPVNTVTLSGSGSDPDGSIASFGWIKISGPVAGTISNAAAAMPTVSGLTQGEYQYQLTVTDNSGATNRDTVKVTVNSPINIPPAANAGVNINITLPVNTATLDGSGTDQDGNIVSYLWAKIGGPSAGSIASPAAAVTSAIGLQQGVYLFQLTVTDDVGAIGRDTVQVTVNAAANQAPIVNAGNNILLTLPTNSATLSAVASDPDGTIAAYLWTKISGPVAGTLTNSTVANANIAGLVQGVYQYRVRVTDNLGATASDTVIVTVNAAANILPRANAGQDLTITLPVNTVDLNGSGTDPDGTIVSYNWAKISGPNAGSFTNASAANTTATGLVQGLYRFQLTVTDNSGAQGMDTVLVTVNPAANQAPIANAGNNISLTLPANTAVLPGSAIDNDGTVVSYAWVKLAGPAAGTLTNANTPTPTVNGLVQGTYQYQLTVTDNAGAVGRDTTLVIVLPAANVPPVVSAGSDITITLPVNAVVLNGNASDPDGSIVSHLWTKISGPAAGTIVSQAAAVTAVAGLTEGIYQYRLTVTDNSGAVASDVVQVNVIAAPNIPPVAHAGDNMSIVLPPNSTTLSGYGTDADGTVAAYKWEKISGPAGGIITNPNTGITPVTELVFGVYEFKFTVTDNLGATSSDTMTLTVGEGRKDKEEISLSVYPNPVVKDLNAHIVTSVSTGNAVITLFDAQGQVLVSRRIQLTGAAILQTIDMTAFAKGTYHLKVSVNGKLQTTKTIVKGG
ncbi:MAG: tandem-95 repeat protein [Chitinophagaceae bacterium]|nr:MAG: tandem-95 repeat protein [Chitinophagaceae bacterium]